MIKLDIILCYIHINTHFNIMINLKRPNTSIFLALSFIACLGMTSCEDSVDPLICDEVDWYPDADGDGKGDPNGTPITACDQPAGHTDNNLDDDDNCASVIQTWFADTDEDGAGDPLNFKVDTCFAFGFVGNSEDCDDNNDRVIVEEDKALDILQAFAFDTAYAFVNYVSPNLIQHDHRYADGNLPWINAFNNGDFTGNKLTRSRTIIDNNIVITHSLLIDNLDRGFARFDVFQMNNGLLTEYWNNIELILNSDPAVALEGSTAVEINDTNTMINKTLVSDIIQNVFINTDTSVISQYFDSNYVNQAFITLPDDKNSFQLLKDSISQRITSAQPFLTSSEFVYGQGNMVLAMSEGYYPSDPSQGIAFYQLFRIRNNLVIESWEVREKIIASTMNPNGKW